MVQRLWVKADDGRLTELPMDRIDEARASGWLWLDLSGDDHEAVTDIGERFGLHPLAVEDVLESTQYPKVEDFSSSMIVVLHALGPPDDPTRTVEVDIILGPGYLLSFHREPVPGLEWLAEQASATAALTDGAPDRMAARLAEALSRRMLPIVDELEEQIGALEDLAVAAHPSVVPASQALRHDAIRLRRILAPQREVVLSLSREGHDLVSARARQRFGDVYDHIFRVVENLDTARSLLASVLDTYRSSVAESMNAVMKVLTVFSAILLPLTLLTGIYGMNFEHMPELSWPWAYFGLLGVMAATAIGLWVYFSRRGFVGGPRLSSLPKAVGRGIGLGMRGVQAAGTAPIRRVAELFRSPSAEGAEHRRIHPEGGEHP